MHQRIYIVDDNFVATKTVALMSVQGIIRLTIKVGLFSGLMEDEIIYTLDKHAIEREIVDLKLMLDLIQ